MKETDKKHKGDSKTDGNKKSDVKHRLHSRNRHRNRYDLKLLVKNNKDLGSFITENKYGDDSIDFSNPKAVFALNRALLKQYYDIVEWNIPEGYLCPPIPGRADYLHYIADLLAQNNYGNIPKGKNIVGMDIGVGANCIYPIIGNKEYGWSFIGSEIDPIAIESGENIVNNNPVLKDVVELRLQNNLLKMFKGVVKNTELLDFVICNPPFHSSEEEAISAATRKLKNLNISHDKKPVLNFGGQANELWYDGGELEFVNKMIFQSKKIGASCYWFSSLISKQTNLKKVSETLKNVRATEVKTIPMGQGNKTSRIVAWTFLNKEQRTNWREKRWNKDNKQKG